MNILRASINMACINAEGYTFNVEGHNFPVMHEFINKVVGFYRDKAYMVAERGRSLGVYANYCIDDISEKSLIKKETKLLVDPRDIISTMWEQFTKLTDLADKYFFAAHAAKDSGSIGFLSMIKKDFDHFVWEFDVMKKEFK